MYAEITVFFPYLFDPAACATEVFKIASRWVCRFGLAAYVQSENLCKPRVTFMMSPFASTVPTYRSITIWCSMMLRASTPILLKQNGRFVPEFHPPVIISNRDEVAFYVKHVYVHFWCRKTVQPAAKYLWTWTFLHLLNFRSCWTTWLRVPLCRFAFHELCLRSYFGDFE